MKRFTILFDDTYLRIDILAGNEINFVSNNDFEFKECVDVLLTMKQLELFHVDSKNREFNVHHNRIYEMFKKQSGITIPSNFSHPIE